ncbi:MAG: hypothetical protein ACPHJ3_13480, partial [Rubripirellula sp.]
ETRVIKSLSSSDIDGLLSGAGMGYAMAAELNRFPGPKHVLELADEMGIESIEAALTRHDIYTADECFLTGSAAEVIAAVKLDDRQIGEGKPGPITKQLNEAFRILVRQ